MESPEYTLVSAALVQGREGNVSELVAVGANCNAAPIQPFALPEHEEVVLHPLRVKAALGCQLAWSSRYATDNGGRMSHVGVRKMR